MSISDPDVLEFPYPPSETLTTDEQLQSWTIESNEEVLPQLSASTSHWYFIALLALLPGLMWSLREPIDNASAVWGLLSLNYLQSDRWLSWFDIDSTTLGLSIDYRPPLTSWLAALCQQFPTMLPLHRHCLPAYLSMAGLVFLVAGFSRHFLTRRGMIFLSLLVSMSGPLLYEIRTGSSLLPGLLCGLGCWDFLVRSQRHKEKHRDAFLIASSFLAGLLFFTNSILAISNGLGIACWLTIRHFQSSPLADSASLPMRDRAKRNNLRNGSWKTLPLAAVAFLMGGAWWPIMMLLVHGPEFLTGTLSWPSEFSHWYADMRGAPWEVLLQGMSIVMLSSVKILAGASICGLVGAIPVSSLSERSQRLQLIAISQVVGVVLTWSICSEIDPTLRTDLPFWSVLLTLPLMFSAVLVVDSFCTKGAQTRYSNPMIWAVGTIFLWGLLPDYFANWSSIILTLLMMFLLTSLLNFRKDSATFLKSAMVVVLMAMTIVTAFPRELRSKDTPISWFKILMNSKNVQWCRLLIDEPPPPRLLFSLQRLWPVDDFRILEKQSLAATIANDQTFPPGDGVIIFWGVEPYLPTDQNAQWKFNLLVHPQYYVGEELFFYRVSRTPKTVELAGKSATGLQEGAATISEGSNSKAAGTVSPNASPGTNPNEGADKNGGTALPGQPGGSSKPTTPEVPTQDQTTTLELPGVLSTDSVSASISAVLKDNPDDQNPTQGAIPAQAGEPIEDLPVAGKEHN